MGRARKWRVLSNLLLSVSLVLAMGGLVALEAVRLSMGGEYDWGVPAKPEEYPVPEFPGGLNCGGLNHFSSEEALREFVGDIPDTPRYYGYGLENSAAAMGSTLAGFGNAGSATSYSTTNNQVRGVDEADIVKTDGEYIYAVSGGSVVILRAFPPPDAEIVSRIPTSGWDVNLFLNGDRLVVLQRTSFNAWAATDSRIVMEPHLEGRTDILIYDVSTPSSPELDRNISVTGRVFASRMIGDHVYLMMSSYVYELGGELRLPTIAIDGAAHAVSHSDIGYFEESRGSSSLTMVLAVNVREDVSPRHEVIVTDVSREVYVSRWNVYIAGSSRHRLSDSDGGEETVIHKFSIYRGEVCYRGSGTVPGSILNQFSLDEHDGYLRVATTIGHVSGAGGGSRSNVYVLNETMAIVGSLEGLAPGERIYSSRFVGDRGYLVTFKKVDPFFVIDLSDPESPQVLGYLKIPGFSSYMQPLDANHVLGLGKDTVDAAGGDFAWFQGVKLSLFDVTDVDNPKELSKYVIGERGTSSEALGDHKAFLFIPSHNLVVIPVDLVEGSLLDILSAPVGLFLPDQRWQGVYVLSVTVENGIQYRGRISHAGDPACGGNSAYPYYSYGCNIRRSLYIGNVLYTLSNDLVRMHHLNGLRFVGQVAL
jgi:hypothetical protein